MTDERFQGRVLRELGGINTTLAVVADRQCAQGRRLKSVEDWQDAKDNKAEATGEHRIEELQAELSRKRRQWVEWAAKAAFIAMGSALAILAPACARLAGL